jgi:hypothetical protein
MACWFYFVKIWVKTVSASSAVCMYIILELWRSTVCRIQLQGRSMAVCATVRNQVSQMMTRTGVSLEN